MDGMTASHPFARWVAAARGGFLAFALVVLSASAACAASPTWSLKKPEQKSPSSGWSLPHPAPANQGTLPMLPDPTGGAVASATVEPRQDFTIAPSVDNILNSRHDLSEDQMGLAGSSDTYVRSVGRTFGLAIKKALY